MRRSTAQSFHRYPLTQMLGAGGNVRVLRLLAAQGAPLSVTQLAREAGMTRAGVRAALAALAQQGVVITFGQGHAVLYALNQAHPMAPALQALFASERKRWESLLADLRRAVSAIDGVEAAWLYGSTSRGEDAAGSDLDLALVVRQENAEALRRAHELLQAVEDKHLVRVSVVALPAHTIPQRAAGDRWWANLVRDAQTLKGPPPARFAAPCECAEVPG